MRLFVLILTLTVLAGCTSYTRVHNGRTVLQSSCGIGGFSCSTETNDQVYPTAQAKYGQMPGNLQDGFAVEEAVAVHQRTMNSQLYSGYWGYGGGFYPPVTSYRFIQPPARGYHVAPPMTMSVGPIY